MHGEQTCNNIETIYYMLRRGFVSIYYVCDEQEGADLREKLKAALWLCLEIVIVVSIFIDLLWVVKSFGPFGHRIENSML